jgi:N6-adenosine-specific RNA methylase IME4
MLRVEQQNNDLTTVRHDLPANIDDLSKFVLVGREKLVAVRAEIRAIDKVGLAQEVREQKLKEAQDIADAVLDAEVRIGELMSRVPKASGGDRRSENFKSDNGVVFEKPKADIIRDAGFTPKQVQRFQTLAAHPEIVEQAKAEARENDDIVSRSLVLNMVKERQREEREARREEERQDNAEKVERLSTPLDAVGLFQTIVIDPPWDWGDEGDVNQFGRAKPDYFTMPIEKIEALPVGKIADDNCHLYLWVTNRSLPKAFRLIDAWGFRYVTCLTWCKPSFGMGNYFRGSTEQVLFCVKGSQPIKRHDVGTWFLAERGDRHSAKPDEFYKIVESCSYGPYIDVFGRDGREGWVVWGENG